MLDTIILLTGPAEQPALAALLRGHNPQATICPVITAGDLAALEPALLRRARLIAFVTGVIVPASILNQLGYGAYNFHPGPPHYPGWAPLNFAIYDQETNYGVTAHLMTERVDSGPIVGFELFQIPPGTTLLELNQLAFVHIARLLWNMAKTLTTQPRPLAELPMRWSGRKSSRRQYAEMCDIPLDISKAELERRIRAFGGNQFDMSPTIKLHGLSFQLMVKDVPSPVAAEPIHRVGPSVPPPSLHAPGPHAADLW